MVARFAFSRVPKLSVIIISYKMTRELPRTLRSFSPLMQKDMHTEDYELIVVDNGSPAAPDTGALEALAPNVSVHYLPNASPSPVAAINFGLGLARGDLVGVCIDGARMASPGLLATASAAANLHPRPVIGTIAFHLGPDVQMESIKKGYNQQVEDDLLASINWQEDGYRLFDISAFAGSSRAGWFTTPAETNALFLRAAHWKDLGGYDERFAAPGGGLANLDTWKRACDDPAGELIMLLGEATFHQVHGGVATNNPISPWDSFHDEYVQIRGVPYSAPTRRPRHYGAFGASSAASIRLSNLPQ